MLPIFLGIPIVFNILAMGIVAAITILLVIGIKESSRTTTVMVIIKLIVLIIFIIVGFQYVNRQIGLHLLPMDGKAYRQELQSFSLPTSDLMPFQL